MRPFWKEPGGSGLFGRSAALRLLMKGVLSHISSIGVELACAFSSENRSLLLT
ncbi:hypothetical protein PMI16_04743 [Herbaspirillum sp. CF444]|nr:hypothetical protein PMI16_04743 [Herbaspirillum sp. CF444]